MVTGFMPCCCCGILGKEMTWGTSQGGVCMCQMVELHKHGDCARNHGETSRSGAKQEPHHMCAISPGHCCGRGGCRSMSQKKKKGWALFTSQLGFQHWEQGQIRWRKLFQVKSRSLSLHPFSLFCAAEDVLALGHSHLLPGMFCHGCGSTSTTMQRI